MNHGSQFLFLSRAGFKCAASRQSIDHALVQIGGGQFDRMARQGSSIEAIKPTGSRIVSRILGRDFVIADAIPARLGESSVGQLKHAEGARGRPIDLQRIPRPLPTPVGARNGIAVALDLRQRGEQFRRDNAGGVLLKKRAVTLPCRSRSFSHGATDRGEELTGFADHLIDQVKREEPGKAKNAPPNDASIPEEFGNAPRLSPGVPDTAMDGSCHGQRLTSR